MKMVIKACIIYFSIYLNSISYGVEFNNFISNYNEIESKIDYEVVKKWIEGGASFVDLDGIAVFSFKGDLKQGTLSNLPNPKFPFKLNLSGTNINQSGLSEIENLEEMNSLTLSNIKVGGGLQYLKKLTNLKELYIDMCEISDSDLEHLSYNTSLKKISICGNFLTDNCIKYFNSISNLTDLIVYENKITLSGFYKLFKANPMCRINWYQIKSDQIRLNKHHSNLMYLFNSPSKNGYYELAKFGNIISIFVVFSLGFVFYDAFYSRFDFFRSNLVQYPFIFIWLAFFCYFEFFKKIEIWTSVIDQECDDGTTDQLWTASKDIDYIANTDGVYRNTLIIFFSIIIYLTIKKTSKIKKVALATLTSFLLFAILYLNICLNELGREINDWDAGDFVSMAKRHNLLVGKSYSDIGVQKYKYKYWYHTMN